MKHKPDPDNDSRAEWGATAIRALIRETNADQEDALADLLCDLMHLSNRDGYDFDRELDRAREHYRAETIEGSADA